MCEPSAAVAALAAAARVSPRRSVAAPQRHSIFDGLSKMKAQAAKAASEGRHIPTTAERMAEMDAAARQTAARRRGPGRPPKDKAIDLTGSAAVISKLQVKRKAAAEGAAKAAKALQASYARWTGAVDRCRQEGGARGGGPREREAGAGPAVSYYLSYTPPRLLALFSYLALREQLRRSGAARRRLPSGFSGQLPLDFALTFLSFTPARRHLQNHPDHKQRFTMLKESVLRSWINAAATPGYPTSAKKRGRKTVLSDATWACECAHPPRLLLKEGVSSPKF